MTKTFDLLINFISSPKTTIEEIKTSTYSFIGILVLSLAFLSQQSAGSLIFLNSGKQPLPAFIAIYVITFLVLITTLVVISAWTHFMAEFMGAQANVKTFLSAIFFSFTPLFLLLPISSILAAWIPDPVGWYMLFICAIYFWIAYLVYASIKNVYSLSVSKAMFVFFSPMSFPFLFFLLLILLGIIVWARA